MNNEKRAQYVTRNSILKLLSDGEVARVSLAETVARLADGDEYVDLEKLERGVQKALGDGTTPMGLVLPRKAVLEKTWEEIVSLLSVDRADTLRQLAN